MWTKEFYVSLTENEILVLRALWFNHYGNTEAFGVWSWAIDHSSKPSGLAKASIPGVVSSLCQKGVLSSDDYGRSEHVLWLRPAAREFVLELAVERGWLAGAA